VNWLQHILWCYRKHRLEEPKEDETEEVGKFDKIFAEEGKGLPLAFLRALAWRESKNNPLEASGPAWGLLQVGIDRRAGNVLKSYNERHNLSLKKQDMLDPRLNTRVASELLRKIVALHKKEGLTEDWTNGNWTGLIAIGWNTGYSYKAGSLRTLRYLKKHGIPITMQAMYANAAKAAPKTDSGRRFVKRMAQKRRQKWHRGVVRSTFKEQGLPSDLTAEGTTDSSWMPLLLLALLLR